MPTLQFTRQAETPEFWLSTPDLRGLLLHCQADWPEAMADAVGGQAWLRLLSQRDWPLPEPAARFACRATLVPESGGLTGDWRSTGRRLPLANASISRLDLRFVLECVPQPEALLAECARTLCDEGRLVVFGLNPLGLSRLRWARRGLHSISARRAAAVLRLQGLDVLDQRALGPLWWSAAGIPDGATAAGEAWRSPIGRAAWAILATRRSATLTPMRRAAVAWRGTPGVPAA